MRRGSPASGRHRPPHVVYWGTQPSPYVVDRFNAVSDAGAVRLEAWFDRLRESDRSWDVDPTTWNFPSRIINPDGGFRVPIPELLAARPDLTVQVFDRQHFAMGFLVARAVARRTSFRVLPTFESWAPRTLLGELSKHFLFRGVDAAKVPGPAGRLEAARYGLPPDRCWSVTQAIDVDHYSTGRDVDPAERTALRHRLGLTGTVFSYVGRLWKGKGLDHLLAAVDVAQRSIPDLSLLVIGDGVDEDRYRYLARNNPRVVFAGHVQPAQLPRWYGLCDALVFPTLGDPNGLVVEEAMAAGLPVIATTSAGDIGRRVLPGRNGFLVPPADAAALADRMTAFARDPDLQRRMRQGAIDHANKYRLARYAEDFAVFVDATLSAPKRRSASRLVSTALGTALLLTSGGPAQPLRPAHSPSDAPARTDRPRQAGR